MGLCYVIAIFIQDLIQAVPNTFIQTMGSMTFFIGLFVAYGVKWVMGKLNLKQYHDRCSFKPEPHGLRQTMLF